MYLGFECTNHIPKISFFFEVKSENFSIDVQVSSVGIVRVGMFTVLICIGILW